MPRDYERDYNNDDSADYKRKRRPEEEGAGNEAAAATGREEMQASTLGHDGPQMNEKTTAYLGDCLEEKKRLQSNEFTVSRRLLDDEIEKILISGRIPKPEIYANVYSEKPIRVAQKVLFPIKEYPKFNFVGKILGPKGNTLRQLQEETMCKMTILGRNSMRDHSKEEELRNSGNPKYAHLNRDLHVEISTVAPPSEAYHRLAYALAEVRKFMVPDANDDIRLEQMRELDSKDRMYKKTHYPKTYQDHEAAFTGRTPPPPMPPFEKTKPKVYSILEKARYIMDDPNYGLMKPHRVREHELYDHPSEYERGYGTPPPVAPSKHSSGHHTSYEAGSYEHDYRREYHPQSSYAAAAAAAYAAKASNGRIPSSTSSYRASAAVTPHASSSSALYEGGSRSREGVRFRTAPYPKLR